MRILVTTVRGLAILAGFFLVCASFLDILGLVPHSVATPPLSQRAAHSVPLAAAGALLLLPYRAIGSRRFRIATGCGLFLVLAWILAVSADGVAGYVSGRQSWHVIPSAILLSALAAGNLWAFLRITAGRSPVSMRRTTPA